MTSYKKCFKNCYTAEVQKHRTENPALLQDKNISITASKNYVFQ